MFRRGAPCRKIPNCVRARWSRGSSARRIGRSCARPANSDAQLAQPFIGLVTTEAQVTPCTMGLAAQAQNAKRGIAGGGRHAVRIHHDHRRRQHDHEPRGDAVQPGEPRDHRGLPSRRSRPATVLRRADRLRGCDKTLPGVMMADGPLQPAVRCSCSAGARQLGAYHGRDVSVLDTYEGVGGVHGGRPWTEDEDRGSRAGVLADRGGVRRAVYR